MEALHGKIANKRIPVTEEIWESLSELRKPGQTYDLLISEMIALKQEHDFLAHLEEVEKTGEFMTLDEVAKELKIGVKN
jgi:hypothetical protein